MYMSKLFLTEEEKNDVSNQYDDIDRGIMSFLIRRYKVEEKNIGDDEWPINVVTIKFEGLPDYGFNSFSNRKQIEKHILEMLEDHSVINLGEYNPYIFDKNRQKVIKTIRAFLNFAIPKK